MPGHTSTDPSTAPDLDVVAVGNAIVDVIAEADEAFIVEHGLARGAMTLIDADAGERLYAAMGPGVESSGGSAANTAVGVASLGGRAGFVGKVRDDQLGEVFAHDIRAEGVAFESTPAATGPPTARCLVLVTPDAQRTMNTSLGIAGQLGPADIDPAFVARAAITYCEGYLWDAPPAKESLCRAMDAAHAAGRHTAFTLSDGFCVERHREQFLDLLESRVDVVFANEVEITALFSVDTFGEALGRVAAFDREHPREAVPRVWALTRSEKGSSVVCGETVEEVPAEPVSQVVDTTGAGDLYAAGFLYGLTHGAPLATCATLGAVAAAEVISHVGARPHTRLESLVDGSLP